MIEIKRYSAEHKNEWDSFVSLSKNGTFLHKRDFMEYHSDRFHDYSLLFYSENKLIALLPANITENVLYSHQGLTYGGLILGMHGAASLVLHVFEELLMFLREQDIRKFIYKAIPYIYHKQAADEDLYALFRNDATILSRNLSCCVYMKNRLKYQRLRKRSIEKARQNNVVVEEAPDLSESWKIIEDNLSDRYGVKPVHTMNEMIYLKQKFPENIRAFQSRDEEMVLAGAVIFETETSVHVQYTSANEKGKKTGALDIIYDYLLDMYSDKLYFDFGTSNEKNGLYLNEGLISQKEGFGGRGVVYDTYQVDIK